MNIRFLNQPKEVSFIDVLTDKISSGNYSKIWLVAGFTKDSALDMLYDSVKEARDKGTSIECVFGLDKKNTSKDMLLKFLNLGCKIRFHINADESKFESRMFVFESDSGESLVYVPGSKLSEGGVTNNITLIEEITYAQDEKIEFSKVKAALENGLVNGDFEELTEEKLKELASTGDIMARITERKIPSINELYNSSGSEEESAIQTYDESSSTNYKDLLEKDVDISIDSNEAITVQTSLGEEVEHKLKKSSEESEEKVITKIIPTEKEPDFDSVSTLIIQLSNSTQDEIRIPSSITSNLKVFFNYPDAYHVEEDEKGNMKEARVVELELFENTSNFQSNIEAQILFSAKTTSIKTSELEKTSFEDGDIMRLIKIDAGKYRCEIIKQGTNEYEIWQNFCTTQVKGSSKKFGIL